MSNEEAEITRCCMLLLRLAGLAYEVSGVVFLVKDYHVAHICPGSHLWAYVLVSLLLGTAAMNTFYTQRGEPSTRGSVCYALGAAGMAAWGGYELIVVSCPPLLPQQIHGYSVATFILQVLSAVAAIICCVGGRVLDGDGGYADMA